MSKTGLAFVGCGYVADLYMGTLENHTGALGLEGVFDRRPERIKAFTEHHGVKGYPSLEALLADPKVDIVVNLTNPDQHFAVSSAALEAGKHVYSEKPLAMRFEDAAALVALAKQKGLTLSGAPGSVLSASAQTLWRAVREGMVGAPRLAYAEIDDGLVHQENVETWISAAGAPWPATDEYRVGCTVEHAGYALTWLVAMFGPVKRVRSFASLLIADKGPSTPQPYETPDFTAACLVHESGVVSRLTNSIVATHDHQMRVFGDEGELRVEDIWDNASPVTLHPIAKTRMERRLRDRMGVHPVKRVKPVATPKFKTAKHSAYMDFCAALEDMAAAIAAGRAPKITADFALHITEVTLAIQYPDAQGKDYIVTTTFPPLEPVAFAEEAAA